VTITVRRPGDWGLADSAWPKWQCNGANEGRGDGLGATGRQRWTFATGGNTQVRPVALAEDGTIYAPANYYSSYTNWGRLYAVNPDGSQKWVANLAYGLSTPTVGANGTIYVCDSTGVYALDPMLGNQLWRYQVGSAQGVAIGEDGTLYVGAGNDLIAIDQSTGTQKWTKTLTGPVSGLPALGKANGFWYVYVGVGYVAGQTPRVFALNPDDGTESWRFDLGPYSAPTAPVLGADGTVYVGQSTSVFALNGWTGARLWMCQLSRPLSGWLALDSAYTVYLTDDRGRLYAIEGSGARAGQQKWTWLGVGAGYTPAIAGDGVVYFGADDSVTTTGRVYAIDESTGLVERPWMMTTAAPIYGGSPAIAGDGTLYIMDRGGTLYAIGPETPNAPTVTANARSAGLNAQLSGSATANDPGIDIEKYEWDFDGDQVIDATIDATKQGPGANWTYAVAGTYTATLTATDSHGASASATVQVTVQ
jgi:outer membrane protein assembly factor BamB